MIILILIVSLTWLILHNPLYGDVDRVQPTQAEMDIATREADEAREHDPLGIMGADMGLATVATTSLSALQSISSLPELVGLFCNSCHMLVGGGRTVGPECE